LSRRDFIAAGAIGAGGILAGMGVRGNRQVLPANIGAPSTLVVARRNGTVASMVDQCVGALGGIESFVPTGGRVAIKVNASWNNPAANTNPEVVKQVVLMVEMAQPSGVVVYDHVIQSRGWEPIASEAVSAGAEAAKLTASPSQYATAAVDGVGLKSARVAKVLDEADVLINLPVLKTHSSGEVTIGLKNHLGTVLDRDAVHMCNGHGLHQGIADVNTCPAIRSKHRLTICDALRPMTTGGPSSGTFSHYGGILAGVDPVATDYVGTQIIRRYNSRVPQNPSHIQRAADLGLGTNDPSEIVFDEPGTQVPEPVLPVGLAILAAIAYRRGSNRGLRIGRKRNGLPGRASPDPQTDYECPTTSGSPGDPAPE
jgi:uncharacterized protein (DUF362 family)